MGLLDISELAVNVGVVSLERPTPNNSDDVICNSLSGSGGSGSNPEACEKSLTCTGPGGDGGGTRSMYGLNSGMKSGFCGEAWWASLWFM